MISKCLIRKWWHLARQLGQESTGQIQMTEQQIYILWTKHNYLCSSFACVRTPVKESIITYKHPVHCTLWSHPFHQTTRTLLHCLSSNNSIEDSNRKPRQCLSCYDRNSKMLQLYFLMGMHTTSKEQDLVVITTPTKFYMSCSRCII